MNEPEAGAECGSSARSDLCGGRPKSRGEGRPFYEDSQDLVSRFPFSLSGASDEDAFPRRGALVESLTFGTPMSTRHDLALGLSPSSLASVVVVAWLRLAVP